MTTTTNAMAPTTPLQDANPEPAQGSLHSRALKQLELLQQSLSPSKPKRRNELRSNDPDETQPQPQQQQQAHDSVADSDASLQYRQRIQYLQRLQTFQPSTYFAKPTRLSPIVVARFGWTNVDKDMLQCAGCQAVVAIIFHSQLSKHATERLVDEYQRQMADVHTLACPFRLPEQRYVQQCFGCSVSNSDENHETQESAASSKSQSQQQQQQSLLQMRSSISPFPSAIFASVFSPSEVELLEHVQPTKRLQTLVLDLLQCRGEGTTVNDKDSPQQQLLKLHPYTDIPTYIQAYPKQESTVSSVAASDAAQQPNQPSLPMPSRLAEMIFPVNETRVTNPNKLLQVASQVDRSVLETALLIVLFGWRFATEGTTKDDNQDDQTHVSLSCPFCLASMIVPLQQASGSENDNNNEENGGIEVTTQGVLLDQELFPEWKRARIENSRPWASHKYYCPYECGFASSSLSSKRGSYAAQPLWQWLADKFLKVHSGDHTENQEENSHDNHGASLDQPQPSAWMQIHRMLSQGLADRSPSEQQMRHCHPNNAKKRPRDDVGEP